MPTHPTDWVWDTLQVTGPMARTAEDVALMLQAVAGPSELVAARAAGPRAAISSAPCSARRRARTADRLLRRTSPASASIRTIERVCRAAAFGLTDIGATVEEIELDLSAGRPAFLPLRGQWFVTQMFPRLDQAGQFRHQRRRQRAVRLGHDDERAGGGGKDRGRLWHRFRELFTRFDHLLTPCMAVPPFPVEQNYPDTIAGRPMQTYIDWIAPTFVLSLTGLPVASVPCGLDAGGMPVGLQIVGPPFGRKPCSRWRRPFNAASRSVYRGSGRDRRRGQAVIQLSAAEVTPKLLFGQATFTTVNYK